MKNLLLKIKTFFKELTWTKVWAGIKKFFAYLWSKFCGLLRWRFGASAVLAATGLYLGATSPQFSFNMFLGIVLFFMGVWYIIQEANK